MTTPSYLLEDFSFLNEPLLLLVIYALARRPGSI